VRTHVLLYGILTSVLIYTALHTPDLFSKEIRRMDSHADRQIAVQTDRPAKSAAPISDHATYEAITGESADEDRSVWDSFYKNKNFIFGKEAVGFLRDNIHLIPKGRAFVPAMGEGRNAIYLAKKGFEVDGNDLSEVAVDKALSEARAQKVSIKTIIADLTQYKFQPNYYDFVLVSLFYKRDLAEQFKKTLKKGGYIMLYLRLEGENQHIKNISPDDFAVKPNELKEEFKDFEIKIYKEYSDHGTKVVGMLARKP
jgi:tellurite methyltransferase